MAGNSSCSSGSGEDGDYSRDMLLPHKNGASGGNKSSSIYIPLQLQHQQIPLNQYCQFLP